jgi:lysophospholipase L1-like esterase
MSRPAGVVGRRGVGARSLVALTIMAVLVMSAVSFSPDLTAPASATSPQPLYYLAMGDSLAAGTGASTTGNRYVNVLYQHELSRFPSLQLDNIACGGATTTSVLHGPGCSYATGTQLGDAEAFLRAHPGQVALVTIDIGGNNVDGCLSGQVVNPTCVQNGMSSITSELPQILSGLEAAYPNLAVYGMNYYDPFLGEWLTGSAGQSLARQSESLAVSLNALLAQLYTTGGAPTADPATLFQTTDFALTGTYLGATEPQNVADVCNWTLFCSGNGNIHANDLGHALLAAAFAQVVDGFAITTASLPNATPGTPYGPVTLTARNAGISASPFTTTLKWARVTVPKGLKLSSTGVLSGTPSKRLTPGATSVTVQVTETVRTLNGTKRVKTRTTVQATIPLTIN